MENQKPKTVLVVDDDQDLLSLLAFLLESEGLHVETATDGRQALNVVARHMPNLIVLDMKMPVMDGWEFARQFRAKHDNAAPIVVLTAYEDAKKRAEEIGAAGWIGKPFDLDYLLSVVHKFVDPKT